MKYIKQIIFSFVLSVTFSGICDAQGLCTRMLQQMDINETYVFDLTAKVSVVEQHAMMGIRESEIMYYKRDSDDSFLFFWLSPEMDKGNGYLRMGDNQWMYRKNTRTFQHISRRDRIGDTGMTTEDLETRKRTELYSPLTDSNGKEIYYEEMLGNIPVYKFEVKAKVKDVSYYKRIYWVQKDNYLLLKQESYSLSGTLMQTVYFTKYTQLQDKFFPIKFLFVDEFERGNSSICTISGISIKNVDDTIFTKAYLENLSK